MIEMRYFKAKSGIAYFTEIGDTLFVLEYTDLGFQTSTQMPNGVAFEEITEHSFFVNLYIELEYIEIMLEDIESKIEIEKFKKSFKVVEKYIKHLQTLKQNICKNDN